MQAAKAADKSNTAAPPTKRPRKSQAEHTATPRSNDNERTQAAAELHGLAHSLEIQLGHGWVNTIPAHLRRSLAEINPDTSPKDHGIPAGPIILILYAGPDTHDALDISMQLEAPWITPYILSIDILRDAKRHDMMDDNLYTHLLRKGQQGEILAIVGGPNCRTWSILLHKPNPDNSPGHPLRGRHEPDCWGMHDLTTEEAHKTDMDSILLLRMLMIYDSAVARGHDPAFLLEHPADPCQHSEETTAALCSSIWATRAIQHFAMKHQLIMTTTPQCALGQRAGAKWTTLMHKHMPGIRKLQDLSCNHNQHESQTNASQELARWAKGLNQAVARALVRTLPNLAHWTNAADSDRNIDKIATPTSQPQNDIHVQIGHKSRPLRDGGGKPSPGRRHPMQRTHPLRALGQALTLGTVAGSSELQPDQRPPTDAMAAGLCKQYPYDDNTAQWYKQTICNYCNSTDHIEPGQPFMLQTIQSLAEMAGDPDSQFPKECAEGLPLGVDEDLPDTRHIWPSKLELTNVDQHEAHIQPPTQQPNYPSAEEHELTIEATFQEELPLGMVEGPLTDDQAAARCGCRPDELCHGALAGKPEGRYLDKLRTIHDATINNVNLHIKRHQRYRTTAPGLADFLMALLLCHATAYTILKLDVTKAHRRIKVLQKDWKYMTAKVGTGIWVNKVGTYGIASAQYHWGRMAALILRLLYYTFPDILWAFVYVDDFAIIIPTAMATQLTYKIVNFLHALGVPLSWKKVALGDPNTWLGYLVDAAKLTACLTPDKQTVITATLVSLMSQDHMELPSARQAAGRLNWATMIYPLTRPFLQPIFKWIMALIKRQDRQRTIVRAKPTATVRLAATHLLSFFKQLPPPHSLRHPQYQYWAATDAGARIEHGQEAAVIGGWFGRTGCRQCDTQWFYLRLDRVRHPWAFERGSPQLHIAAMELYATLLLYKTMADRVHTGAITMQLTLATDNRGNAYQATNHKAKNNTAAAMLMELSLQQHHRHCLLNLQHTYRENNQWADQLTHTNTTGFDNSRQLQPKETDFHILHLLIPQQATQSTA